MSFQVHLNYGCEDEKEFSKYHLLTAVASRSAIAKVIASTSSFLDDTACDTLRKLWTENLANIGGLPNLQQEQSRFDLNLIRRAKLLSEALPPLQLRGSERRPASIMARPPSLDRRSIKTALNLTPSVIQSYVLKKSVRRECVKYAL
jgi:hypothetical protein